MLRSLMLLRQFNRLPRDARLVLLIALLLLMVVQAETFGESLGKALYRLSH